MPRPVAFVSVVPSPYQRDIFGALAQLPELDLRVFYLEAAAPDSPWPEKPLRDFEKILPGKWISLGHMRWHLNWPLPDLSRFDFVVLNTLMSFTAQPLMRGALREKHWIFWGERQRRYAGGWKKIVHDFASSPLHKAAAIAAVGSAAMDDYRERFPNTPCVNIPYHCELQPFFDAPPCAHDDQFIFLFCGQMIARKGLDLLLAAFAQISPRIPNARLLLVGREAELPGMLQTLPAAVVNRIEYAGFQAPEKLPAFFARANAFVLPSRYDGWGVVVNQALAAGLPVICSDTVGAGIDLVHRDLNGIRFPNGNIAALANAMERLATNRELAEKWGAASREIIRDYTPQRGAERWLDLFDSLNP